MLEHREQLRKLKAEEQQWRQQRQSLTSPTDQAATLAAPSNNCTSLREQLASLTTQCDELVKEAERYKEKC